MDGSARHHAIDRAAIKSAVIKRGTLCRHFSCLLMAGAITCSTTTALFAQHGGPGSSRGGYPQQATSAPAIQWIGGNAVEDLPPISIDEFYRAYALREAAMAVVDETSRPTSRMQNGINPTWIHPINDVRVIHDGPPAIGSTLVQPGSRLANYTSYYNGEPQTNPPVNPQSNAAEPPAIRRTPAIAIAMAQPALPPMVPPANPAVEPLPPAGIQAPDTPKAPELEPAKPDTAAGQTAGATQTLNQQTTLGQAPENFSQQFLRRQSVLLGQGEWQFDVGVAYTLFEDDFTTVVPPGILVESQIRRRLLTVPLEFRYGLTDTAQVFINAPLGYVNTEFSQIGFDEFSSDGGIGDTNVGVSMIVYEGQGCASDPDVILTTGVTIPTSEATLLSGILGTADTTLGQGYWAAYWNLLFVHTYDPCVVFYGFGSRHQFEQEVDGFDVLPGGQYNYQLGVGFAVNERITLSTAFSGAYISEAYVDDIRVQGSIQEPMVMRFAVTIAQACKIVEPFAEIGLTEDAPAARIGITCTY